MMFTAEHTHTQIKKVQSKNESHLTLSLMIFTYLEVEIVEALALVIAESRRSSCHLEFQ